MTLGTPPALAVRLGELSTVLWQQRQLIEQLEYRLEVQQLLSIAGKVDWLNLALADVEAVLDDIRRSEDVRLGVVAECSVVLGLPVGATLRELSAAAPDPWNYVLEDHQVELLKLVSTTEALAASNRELANRGLGESRRIFEQFEGVPVSAYGKNGDRPALLLPPTLVNRDA